uniref:ATP-binding cassette domain-containing protein n=1 Tax=Gracilinema caldarium TaxID=215591 RepID=A0A7C3IF61_9SPIR
MITLKKVRLIQWHSFRDVTIPIGERTLFVGENGSGKSTIIDAIQYALVAQLHKIRFNAAANEKRSGRSLDGYVLAKTGYEGEEYQRTEGISHVMLEFEKGEASFSAGICAEITKDTTQVRELPWIAQGVQVKDIPLFLDSTHLLGSQQFKQRMRDLGALVFDSKKEYQKELTHLLGVFRRNVEFNPYLDALVRSIGFVPMDSVNRFVCDYILEERMVDISDMKSNLQSYKDAEAEAELTIKNIAALEDILAIARVWQQHNRTILNQEYLQKRLQMELEQERLEENHKESQRLEAEEQRKTEEIRRLQEELEALRDQVNQLSLSIQTHQVYQLIQDLERRKNQLVKELEQARSNRERYQTLLSQLEALLNRPLERDNADNVDIDGSADSLEKEKETLYRNLSKSQEERENLRKDLGDLARELEELERGLVRYPEGPAELVSALKEEGIQAWIFADLVEVADSAWQNALEGWLNTQRFAVLVEQDQFQRAIAIYDRLPRQIGGVPLPNLERMAQSEVRPHSLAELVVTDSPFARRYADYILGRVIRTDQEHLKDFDQSITQTCLTYSGHTVNRIREAVYSRWYLGKGARERRKAELLARRKELQEELSRLELSIKLMEQQTELLKRALPALTEMRYLSSSIATIPELERSITEISEQMSRVDTSDLEVLRNELDERKRTLGSWEAALSRAQIALGSIQGRVKTLAEARPPLEASAEARRAKFQAFVANREQFLEEWEAYYKERVHSREDRQSILANYEGSLQGTRNKLQKALENYQGAIQKYNHVWNALLSFLPEEASEIEALKKRLEASELPLYKEKISRARAMAEKQFKEHFVTRLNEYIEEARESFREINAILRSLTFGKDQYHFTLEERNDRKAQLEVIRKAAEIHENQGSLFDALISEGEREAVEELFNRILKNELDSFEVRQLCDYRTYFTYDIRVRDTSAMDPKTGKVPELSLSRALKEKSGGESQTPYYVAIAASIYRYYKDDPENTVRLVVFDEAFNKMDERRIGVTLELFQELGMQIITAVPSEKLEIIQPYMDTVNLVLRYGNEGWVRDYRALSTARVTEAD